MLAGLQVVQLRMMNDWHMRGGMETKGIECRLKEV